MPRQANASAREESNAIILVHGSRRKRGLSIVQELAEGTRVNEKKETKNKEKKGTTRTNRSKVQLCTILNHPTPHKRINSHSIIIIIIIQLMYIIEQCSSLIWGLCLFGGKLLGCGTVADSYIHTYIHTYIHASIVDKIIEVFPVRL